MAEPPPVFPPAEWELADEQRQLVRAWRFDQASRAGLNPVDAGAFAESDADVATLRRLAALGASAAEIVRIVL